LPAALAASSSPEASAWLEELQAAGVAPDASTLQALQGLPEADAAQLVQGALAHSRGDARSTAAVLLQATRRVPGDARSVSSWSQCSSARSHASDNSQGGRQAEPFFLVYRGRKQQAQDRATGAGSAASQETVQNVAREIADISAWAECIEGASADRLHPSLPSSKACHSPRKRAQGVLTVHIIAAFNLEAASPGGSSSVEAFASARVGGQEFSTHAVRGTWSPAWFADPFEFTVDLERKQDRTLHLDVWNRAGSPQGKHETAQGALLGRTQVELLAFETAGACRVRQALKSSGGVATAGELELELRFEPYLPPKLLVLGDDDALCTRLPKSCDQEHARRSRSLQLQLGPAAGAAMPHNTRHVEARCWQYLEARHPELRHRRNEREVCRLRNSSRQADGRLLPSEDAVEEPGTPAMRQCRKPIDAEVLRRLQLKLKTRAGSAVLGKLLRRCGQDGRGSLETKELRHVVRSGLKVTPQELSEVDLDALISALDRSGMGTLELRELIALLKHGVNACERDTALIADELRARELLMGRFAAFLHARASEICSAQNAPAHCSGTSDVAPG